jgi:Flp pilus assembly pilin Flp
MKSKQRGAAVMEYAMLLSGVLLSIVGVMYMFEDRIQDVFEHINRLIN